MMEHRTKLFGWGGPAHYQIRVKGRLERRWELWFDGLQLSTDHETTTLSGTLVDQAALYGVLLKIRDLGLLLLSVQRLALSDSAISHHCRLNQKSNGGEQ
ncbi:MAG TPA: hypothetical protein VKR06_34370 [Ktedonosporobacter sp.]|nr:hypothetical protein [Ktedonosporobacter sp.]